MCAATAKFFILQTQIVSCRRADNLELMRLFDEEFLRHPFYGSRKMKDYLNRKGIPVNRKRIQLLISLMGLESIAPKPNTSRQRKGHKVYPYLLNKMSITEPNRVWCSDITYIRLAHGFVYVTAVMDWTSRYVLSWEVSLTMDDDFFVNALKSVLRKHKTPEIFNTDHGAQYTGKGFTGALNIMAFKSVLTVRGAVWITSSSRGYGVSKVQKDLPGGV